MLIKYFITATFFILQLSLDAQTKFPEKYLGEWKGMMKLYKNGVLYDSVLTQLTIAKTPEASKWMWKTEYLSEKYPITKDYKLLLIDSITNHYIIDEGDGIKLDSYLFNNKIYSNFSVDDQWLTSYYEFLKDSIIFEITIGKLNSPADAEVKSYTVTKLQRVVFQKVR